MNYFMLTLIAIGCFLNMIVIHEWGHYIYFRVMKGIQVDIRMKRTPTGREIICGNPQDYTNMTKTDKIMMLTWGILFGLVPLTIYLSISDIIMVMLVPYVIACTPDIKSITEVIRNG